MLELLVLLLCGSIIVSGMLGRLPQQSHGGDGERRAGEPVRCRLLPAAGGARRGDDRGVDRLRPVDADLSLCDPPNRRCEGVDAWLELIGSILILLGAIFLFSAGLGMLRMPDALHAPAGRHEGVDARQLLVLAGIAFYHPGWSLKLLIVIYFVLMTNPISSHALARAAHAIRIPMARDDRDRRAARRQG